MGGLKFQMLLLAIPREIGACREILPNQAVGILVCLSLARAVGIAEVGGCTHDMGHLPMFGEFRACNDPLVTFHEVRRR